MRGPFDILEDYDEKCYRGTCHKELFSVMEAVGLLKESQLEVIKHLEEDYTRRLTTVLGEIAISDNGNKITRLENKAAVYRSLLGELNQLKHSINGDT